MSILRLQPMATAACLLAVTNPLTLPSAAHAAGLTIDPQHPPQVLDGRRVRFAHQAGFVDYEVLDAVVVHTVGTDRPHPHARSLGGQSWRVPVATVTDALDLSLRLARNPDIDAVFPDVKLPTAPFAGDPNRTGQWYLDAIEMDPLHALSLGDPSVRVAVIDSGIDIGHADLIDRVAAPYDAFDDDEDPSPNPGEYCGGASTSICDEHGTAVAGVTVATANNDVGIHGMCPECTLIPIKMLGDGRSALSADIAAFEHAIAEDAWVINNSWGFTSRIAVPEPLAAVIERARTEPREGLGAVVVFAAGNDNREVGAEELQALPGVLCVSAIDNYGYSTSYTNFGAPIDVAAPSATVSITPIAEVTTDFGGTSAAAPVVSGLAAWILSVDPTLSAAEVTELIVSTASESPFVTHDETGHHDVYGYGIITPASILEAMTANPDTGAPGGNHDSGSPASTDASTAGEPASKQGCATAPGSGGRLLASLGLLVMMSTGLRRKTARWRSPR